MVNTFTASQYICISASESGTEIELQMVATFKVHPGCKATMIDPPEGPTAEVDQISFFLVRNGKASPDPASLPVWMINLICDTPEFQEWMLSEATEQALAAAEDAADHRREMMREASDV